MMRPLKVHWQRKDGRPACAALKGRGRWGKYKKLSRFLTDVTCKRCQRMRYI